VTPPRRPVFRIESSARPARILMLGVSHADSDEPVWEIATVEWAGRPIYTATTQIVLDVEPAEVSIESGSEIQGEPLDVLAFVQNSREVSSVTYGEVPRGFQQTYPQRQSPPALSPGADYKVAVIGYCLGETIFTA
jgi:hypothetical protein